jgi:hypothetical protein
MKSIDFSQPGGFPLTQDNLDYLQQSYSEAVNALAAVASNSSMFVKDNLGISWIRLINSGINSGGQFYINWLKPEIAITGYGVNFNSIIPLG